MSTPKSFTHALIGVGIGLALGAVLQFDTGAAPQSSQGQPAPPATGGRLAFTEPSPLDFNDHEGYVSLFDGVSLKGWDGNPKFWKVEDGAIVGESTPTNPSGNSYIVYRDLDAKDFTLKFEIRGRRHRRERPSIPKPDRCAVARADSARRDGERRSSQSRLDDDGPAG